MYGMSLFRLARLVGLRQVDIAAHFGISTVQIHYWARATRPIPPANLPTLITRIADAVECYLATGETDMQIAVPGQADTWRHPTHADLTGVLREVFSENLHRYGHAPAPSLESFLEEMRRYSVLTRPQQLEGPKLAHIEQYMAAMLCWFELLVALLPLRRLLPDMDDQTTPTATAARHRDHPVH